MWQEGQSLPGISHLVRSETFMSIPEALVLGQLRVVRLDGLNMPRDQSEVESSRTPQSIREMFLREVLDPSTLEVVDLVVVQSPRDHLESSISLPGLES